MMTTFKIHYKKVVFTLGWIAATFVLIVHFHIPDLQWLQHNPNTSVNDTIDGAAKKSDLPKDFVLVTAANHNYFPGLKELVGSMHYWEPTIKVAIYDLGLTKIQLAEIKTWCNVVVHDLPKQMPEHILHQPRKMYAWKPYVVFDSFERYHSILFSDAGSNIRGPLSKIKELLYKDGYFFVQGQDLDMTEKSHEGMYKYFNEKKGDFKNKPHFAGGLHGWLRGSDAVQHILYPYVLCAQRQECFGPPGSSLRNHRYDQSVLSIIIYTAPMRIVPHTEFLAASRRQCNSDPFKPSDMLVLTARQGTKDYYSKICNKTSTL
ncbi:unnamed protein product [Owenia fusiformis]|uniref:Uncharacterized protein n=1 Tax=Owenia fusiformis TaxID=6347 RepID=A0A8J1U416_OWEFU|nr:unnamed protein product [Owenia fusiformis]